MINFLPPEAKSAVKHEYTVRVVSIWGLFFATVALVGAMLLLPTYVLLRGQLDALTTEVMESESDVDTRAYQTAHTALKQAHTLARQLGVNPKGPTASAILHEIEKTDMRSITMSGFAYKHNDTKVESVEIRGVAETREALAEFSSALSHNPLFLRADVPVSDLAEAHDLIFTLTIVLAPSAL